MKRGCTKRVALCCLGGTLSVDGIDEFHDFLKMWFRIPNQGALFNLEHHYTYPCGWLSADVNRDSSDMSYLDSGPHHVSMFNLDLTTTGDDISAKFHPSK